MAILKNIKIWIGILVAVTFAVGIFGFLSPKTTEAVGSTLEQVVGAWCSKWGGGGNSTPCPYTQATNLASFCEIYQANKGSLDSNECPYTDNDGDGLFESRGQNVVPPPSTEGGVLSALGSLFGFVFSPIDTVISRVLGLLTSILFVVFGLWVKLAGLLLNVSIHFNVLKMSEFLGPNGVPAIRVGWTIIRDLLNIGFIFAIVYIGIQTILGSGTAMKKTVIGVVTAALLVNFSFFFTGVLIDASNVLTLSIYNKIKVVQSKALDLGVFGNQVDPNASSVSKFFQGDFDNPDNNADISSIFMQYTGIVTIFNASELSDFKSASAFTIALFGSVFFIILIFSFLTIALLFYIRLIVLMILLITSPVAYVGSVFPAIGAYSKEWWSSLRGQLIFAPLYMLMTLIVVLIISDPEFGRAMGLRPTDPAAAAQIQGGFATAFDSGFSTGTVAIFTNYIVIIGLLIATITVSKKYASQGSAIIGNFVGRASKYAAGSFGFVGRQTAGRAGMLAANSKDLQKAARTGKGASGFAARLALRSATKASQGSFDPRATSVGAGIGGVMGAGRPTGKGGRVAVLKAKQKKDAEFKKSLGKPSNAEIEASEEYQGLVTRQRESMSEVDRNIAEEKSNLAKAKEAPAYGDNAVLISELEEKIKKLEESKGKTEEKNKKELGKKKEEMKEGRGNQYADSLYRDFEGEKAEMNKLTEEIRRLRGEIDVLAEGEERTAKNAEIAQKNDELERRQELYNRRSFADILQSMRKIFIDSNTQNMLRKSALKKEETDFDKLTAKIKKEVASEQNEDEEGGGGGEKS